MPDPAHNTQLNKEMRLHAAALLYFLSRLSITVFLFAVPVLYFTMGVVELPFVIGGAVLVGGLFLGYYVAAAPMRCAACNCPVLMDNGNRKHPNAAKFPGLNHRARVAWDILFSSSYQCMYCVTRCRCKKSWGAKSKGSRRTSSYKASAQPATVEEAFPGSIFGDVGEPVTDGEPTFASGGPVQPPPPAAKPQGAPAQRVVTGTFAAASVYPDAQTVPVSLVSPGTGPVPPAPGTEPSTVPVQQEVIIEAPAPAPAPSPLFPASRPVPAAPVPWSIPIQDSPNSAKESPMNQQPNQDSSAPAPHNPFLAAAAAMPPPPTPPLPTTKSRMQPEAATPGFHAEFPYAPATAPTDGPPPWTIPSMPVEKPSMPVEKPAGAAPAPSRDSAPGPAARPAVVPVAATAAPAPGQAQVLREVVSVLEEGQRSLAGAFDNMISKLGAHLTALSQAPATVPAPAPAPAPFVAPPVAAPLVAVAVPVVPTAPVLPALPSPATQGSASLLELPDLITMRPPPSPAQLRAPQGKTAFVPLPVLPPVLPSLPGHSTAPVASPFPAPPQPAVHSTAAAASPFSGPPQAAAPFAAAAASPFSAPVPAAPFTAGMASPFPPATPGTGPVASPFPAPPATPGTGPVASPFPAPLATPGTGPVASPFPAPPATPGTGPVASPFPAPAEAAGAPYQQAPLPYAAPVPPAGTEAAPRRRFARPSTIASPEINQMLQDTFASAPVPASPAQNAAPPPPGPAWLQGNGSAAPAGNGHFIPDLAAAPAPAPVIAPVIPVPPQRQTSPQPAAPHIHPASPFGIADTPLYAPPGAPQEPAPFTFLKNEGGQFTPPPPAPGDPLDDSIMPWMQPVSPGHTRN